MVSFLVVICLSERTTMAQQISKIPHDHKHLTLSDRSYIEQELLQGSSFKAIGSVLHKDPTTISKEIRRYSRNVPPQHSSRRCFKCKHYKTCDVRGSDTIMDCPKSHCIRKCRLCWQTDPTVYCMLFSPYQCDQSDKPPYVCNACDHLKDCPLPHRLYSAQAAQKSYERNLVRSRQGINLTEEELQALNGLISPLILKGQPLSHIFAVHADEIPVCRRTLYNYLDQRIFQARNIDLPRRVRYKKRKKAPAPRSRNIKQIYRNKRTFIDFERFMEAHPDLDVVEMDTVKGSRAAGKCLLTLLFRSCSFMLVILLPRCTQECVIKAINDLTDSLGIRLFRKYFPVLLTDNGSEFKNPWDIEKTPEGKHRTYVFYCDPYVSNQKARLEKNHEYIRYVIPKGRSMHKYTQKDISLMASHINSTARDALNGASPFDLADLLLDKKIPALTGQSHVSPDDVLLKPALIEHNDNPKEAAHE